MPKPATRALIAGASVVGLLLLLRRRRQRRLAARLASLVKLSLLPSERGPLLCMSPATSTVTFFRGPPYVAAASLSRRVRQIVAANPWLTSVL